MYFLGVSTGLVLLVSRDQHDDVITTWAYALKSGIEVALKTSDEREFPRDLNTIRQMNNAVFETLQ